jgi:ubiquitin carboxyl-terminal hydrolase 10
MSPKGVRVDATKQVYLENFPSVLILHVKRFVFDNVGGVQKLRKQVRYSSRMTIHEGKANKKKR